MSFGVDYDGTGLEGASLQVRFSNAAGEDSIQDGSALMTAINGVALDTGLNIAADPAMGRKLDTFEM